MQPIDARNLAWELMRRHGLIGWSFKFDHARRRFGSCRSRSKLITLSRPLTMLNGEAEVRDTLLHEIAHALTPGDGHGAKWKAKCVVIGARPQRCYTEESVVSPARKAAPYEWGCVACNWWVQRRRLTRSRYVCGKCRGKLVYRHRMTTGLAHATE